EDSLRRTEVYWLSGLLLSRLGFPAYASAFLTESLQQARLTGNSQAVIGALSYRASMYESQQEHGAARRDLAEIKDMSLKTEPSREKELVDLNLNLLCGRIEMRSGNLAEAERCLQESNRIVHGFGPKVFRVYSSQSQLARVHALSGKSDLARDEFQQAVD